MNSEVKDSQKEMSALDAYLNRVYKIIILMAPLTALGSAVTFTAFKIIGWDAEVDTTALVIFDALNLVYISVAIYFFRTCIGSDGLLRRDKLKAGKFFISAVILLQWNFISYLVPLKEWWAYAFLFMVLAVFFFDVKMMLFNAVGIIFSMIIFWFVNGDVSALLAGEYSIPDFFLRTVCVFLTTMTIFALTYFGGKFLVEELEKYVNYDTLTHLLNRRSMDNYLQAAHKLANTGRTTFCLLLMDIDDFKSVNDTYGHDCGDEVLKAVAGIISNGVRKDDNVFRWGGEEILVLLNTDEEKAISIAEKIRIEVEEYVLNYRDELKLSVTLTIGLATYGSGKSIQAMMDEADAKLYYGKRHGKNQVVKDLPSDLEVQS